MFVHQMPVEISFLIFDLYTSQLVQMQYQHGYTHPLARRCEKVSPTKLPALSVQKLKTTTFDYCTFTQSRVDRYLSKNILSSSRNPISNLWNTSVAASYSLSMILTVSDDRGVIEASKGRGRVIMPCINKWLRIKTGNNQSTGLHFRSCSRRRPWEHRFEDP